MGMCSLMFPPKWIDGRDWAIDAVTMALYDDNVEELQDWLNSLPDEQLKWLVIQHAPWALTTTRDEEFKCAD